MKNKQAGKIIVGISSLTAFVFGIFGTSTLLLSGNSIYLIIQSTLGLAIFLTTAIMGYHIMNEKDKKDSSQIQIIKFKKDNPIEEIDLTNFSKNEKDIMEKLIIEKEILQKNLMESLELTKVKTTRALKKLEEKNLIEKKRVGINNLIILK